jgi:hypothetical protein
MAVDVPQMCPLASPCSTDLTLGKEVAGSGGAGGRDTSSCPDAHPLPLKADGSCLGTQACWRLCGMSPRAWPKLCKALAQKLGVDYLPKASLPPAGSCSQSSGFYYFFSTLSGLVVWK